MAEKGDGEEETLRSVHKGPHSTISTWTSRTDSQELSGGVTMVTSVNIVLKICT